MAKVLGAIDVGSSLLAFAAVTERERKEERERERENDSVG